VQECLDALVTNEEAMGEERLTELEMVAEAVLDALGRDAQVDGDALLSYLCAAQCNAFPIWGQSGRLMGKQLGVGVFPGLAKLNHSCLPNATVSEQAHGHRRLLTARALADIPQGEEVMVSYSSAGHLLAPEERAACLLRTYCFACRCAFFVFSILLFPSRLLCHSTLGLRLIKKNKKFANTEEPDERAGCLARTYCVGCRCKIPWREAGPPNHHDDKVDSDQ